MYNSIPIDNLVLIELDEIEKVSKGGIIVVSNETEAERQKLGKETGTILSMGPHAFEGMKFPIPKVGDKVMFKRYSGTDATLPSTGVDRTEKVSKRRIMEDKDIYMIIEEIGE